MMMEIKEEKIPNHRIAYMRRIGAYGAENYQLMARMKEWAKLHQFFNDTNILFGIVYDNETTKPENCRYDVAVVISEAFEVDRQVETGYLPGGDYLVFKIPHTVGAMTSFWGNLVQIIKESGYLIDFNRPVLERYDVELVNRGYCEFCFPLKY